MLFFFCGLVERESGNFGEGRKLSSRVTLEVEKGIAYFWGAGWLRPLFLPLTNSARGPGPFVCFMMRGFSRRMGRNATS